MEPQKILKDTVGELYPPVESARPFVMKRMAVLSSRREWQYKKARGPTLLGDARGCHSCLPQVKGIVVVLLGQ